MSKYKTVIVVPVWDSTPRQSNYTIQFVEQMRNFCPSNYNRQTDTFDWLLVIVNNNSECEMTNRFLYELEQERDPAIKVIWNESNHGYGKAANAGLWYGFYNGEAEYGIVMNNDILFNDPNWVENAFVMYLSENPRWFMGARLISNNLLTDFGNGAIPYLEGFALAAHRDAWNVLNGFDEMFVAYFEDTDLSYRASLAGYELKQSPAFRWESDGNLNVAIFRGGSFFHVGGQTGYNTPDFNWTEVTKQSGLYFKRKWGFSKCPVAEWGK